MKKLKFKVLDKESETLEKKFELKYEKSNHVDHISGGTCGLRFFKELAQIAKEHYDNQKP